LLVIVTLFDFRADYGVAHWRESDRHLEFWLTSFRDRPEILAWDLKNEPDSDRRLHGRRSVDRFLKFIAERARNYDPNHLLTIGWYSADASCQGEGDLDLDFVSFHEYGAPARLREQVAAVIRRCGSRPVVLGEFGAPSGILGTGLQAEYFEQAAAQLAGQPLAGYLVWTWSDFASLPRQVTQGDQGAIEREATFGVLDLDASEKPALARIRTLFSRLDVH